MAIAAYSRRGKVDLEISGESPNTSRVLSQYIAKASTLDSYLYFRQMSLYKQFRLITNAEAVYY